MGGPPRGGAPPADDRRWRDPLERLGDVPVAHRREDRVGLLPAGRGNTLFRATRYALDYPAFNGRTLKPGKSIVEIQQELDKPQPGKEPIRQDPRRLMPRSSREDLSAERRGCPEACPRDIDEPKLGLARARPCTARQDRPT